MVILLRRYASTKFRDLENNLRTKSSCVRNCNMSDDYIISEKQTRDTVRCNLVCDILACTRETCKAAARDVAVGCNSSLRKVNGATTNFLLTYARLIDFLIIRRYSDLAREPK
ncbi:hypothetical protein PUN28_017240 [Cardiocondyla obscurior]|uniref:Uncharacterized protein n=1 Tax=Cardiocondyla obscurior TaxID=286306 RepID=A0AAW2EPP2_9HYME